MNHEKLSAHMNSLKQNPFKQTQTQTHTVRLNGIHFGEVWWLLWSIDINRSRPRYRHTHITTHTFVSYMCWCDAGLVLITAMGWVCESCGPRYHHRLQHSELWLPLPPQQSCCPQGTQPWPLFVYCICDVCLPTFSPTPQCVCFSACSTFMVNLPGIQLKKEHFYYYNGFELK